MPLCKILRHYPNIDGWEPGMVVDITDPERLIEQGLVELYTAPEPEPEPTRVRRAKRSEGRTTRRGRKAK